MYEDMPTPGTRQWLSWFNAQEPDTQNQVLFDFGLSDANTPVAGNDVGSMQPEIGAQGYGLLDQLSPPPVVNSKGVIQPSGTEQVQKQTNLFQDQLSLGTDNMLAAIAGQFAPTAFTPTVTPTGNPIQQGGLRQLQSLSQTGGWEGYVAQQMLPTEYGGGGMSASQAKAALLAIVQAPDSDTVSQEARDTRDELLNSLPRRFETSGPSKNPQDTPVNKDITTAQGLTNTFNLDEIDTVARGWQQDLAKDPVAAYTDPTTGMGYEGSKSTNTPTMDWFDKYGLPYANKRYDDPDQIAGMQDATAPWQYQGQGEDEDAARQAALSANAQARSGLNDASVDYDVLTKAYQDANKGGLQSRGGWDTGNDQKPRVGIPGPSYNNGQVDFTAMNQALNQLPGSPPAGQPPAYIQPKFAVSYDSQNRPIGLAGNQDIPSGKSGPMDAGGGMTGSTNFNFDGEGAQDLPGVDFGVLDQIIPGLKLAEQFGGKRKVMTVDDLAPARARVEMAKKTAASTVPGIQAASNSSETSMQRQLARARMMGLAATGRTPLSDTLAGRMMAARTAGVYG